jgi:hypothetical protein
MASPDEKNLTTFMDAQAALLGLPVEGERRDKVLTNMKRLAAMAEPLMALPLASHDEIASLYSLPRNEENGPAA